MAYLLDTDGNSSMYVPLVLRQRDILKLAFWHAQIIVHRPFLLKSFASLTDYGLSAEGDTRLASRKAELERNVQRCLDAAINILKLIDLIDAAKQMYSTLFVSLSPSLFTVLVSAYFRIFVPNSPDE